MKCHFITFGLLALAIGAYLLAIGCMIEVTFWIRLFRSRSN
jgi:hypothetical protein